MSKQSELRKNPLLNERQKRFVDFYVQSCNATESAKKAGYSEKNSYQVGCELLKNPKVQVAIATRLKELESERIAKDKEILEHLTAVMRGETTEEVAMNVGIGKGFTRVEKTRVQVSAKERLKAAELLAKVHGMFVTRQEVDLNGVLPVIICDDI